MSTKNKVNQSPKVSKKTNLIIQLDVDLKKGFQELCKSKDMNCSQVIRQFMKGAVDGYRLEKLNVYKNKW